MRVLPDITRPGVGTVMSSEWNVGTPARQRTAVETIVDVWEEAPWPDGLFSYTLFLGTDGDTLLHYSQWTSEEVFRSFQRTQRNPRVDRIDAAVPGIKRDRLAAYHLYRRFTTDGTRPEPGIIVTDSFEAESPEDARRLVDTLLDGLDADTPRGLVSANFHISADGTWILNYAEWTDEDAHAKSEPAPRTRVFRPYRCLTPRGES